MMKLKTILLFIAALPLFVCAVPAAAEAPLLLVSSPTPAPHGWRVLLTNAYTASVTAYAIEVGIGSPSGRPAVKWADAVPGDLGLRPPLPPGQTASIFVPGRPDTPPSVSVTAVIYADGATTGDPSLVGEFLHVRAFFLAELPAAISQLQAVAADPGATRSQVVARFRQQADANLAALHNGVAGPVSDRISEDIAETLADPSNRSLQVTAGSLAATLQRWQQQLLTSLPKLGAPATGPQ